MQKTKTGEWAIIDEYLKGNLPDFKTAADTIGQSKLQPNHEHNEARFAEMVGSCRDGQERAITGEWKQISALVEKCSGAEIPTFAAAGPRKKWMKNWGRNGEKKARAAVVTTGGLAPGLNAVIHSIVKRHQTYKDYTEGVLGIYDGVLGLFKWDKSYQTLKPEVTETWVDKGGSELGSVRSKKPTPTEINRMVANLRKNRIHILYVIGGDGSLGLAHAISSAWPARIWRR